MTPYVTVPGTWSRRTSRRTWWSPGSDWSVFMRLHGFLPAWPGRPFTWSGDVDGSLLERIAGWFGYGGMYSDWDAGGDHLALYLENLPRGARNVIAHSHGLQVVLFAAARGTRIDRLITVAGPVRKDMEIVAAQARPFIGYWVHVHSDGSDRWQWFGEIGDGALGIVRPHRLANENVSIPDVGHSDLLTDPRAFTYWLGGLHGALRMPL